MKDNRFIPFSPISLTEKEMKVRSKDYLDFAKKRRSVRSFSKKSVPLEVIENIIATASTAPSGANKQPWTFCVVSDEKIKHQIRLKAEAIEKESYSTRMSDEWLEDLKPFATDWNKPYIDDAPYILVVFKKVYDLEKNEKKTNYYVNESVGIALGFLIAAIHHAGLVTVTHTPSPMNFLSEILNRPKNERAFMLLPVGYPSPGVEVPNISKKDLGEIMKIY